MPEGGIAIGASRKRIAPFRLHRPASVAAACAILHERQNTASVCAGGMDLVNRLKAGERIVHLIALEGIAELQGVREDGDALHIGAMTRHWQVESDPLVRARLPSLSAFIAGLGNQRVRMQGTLGGNIMAGEAAYEMLPALAALDASLLFADTASGAESAHPAIAFLQATASSRGLLTGVRIPLRGQALAWHRDLRPAFGLECVVAFTGQSSAPSLGRAVLIGDRRGAVAADLRVDNPQHIANDWAQRLPAIDAASGAGADYCRKVSAVMLRRALARAGEAHACDA
jgi:CO/xanthine dehydrogenase FAD-binding subunit